MTTASLQQRQVHAGGRRRVRPMAVPRKADHPESMTAGELAAALEQLAGQQGHARSARAAVVGLGESTLRNYECGTVPVPLMLAKYVRALLRIAELEADASRPRRPRHAIEEDREMKKVEAGEGADFARASKPYLMTIWMGKASMRDRFRTKAEMKRWAEGVVRRAGAGAVTSFQCWEYRDGEDHPMPAPRLPRR